METHHILQKLSKSLGGEITQTEMVPNFINLLNDTEAVVRTAAASKVTEFSELIPEEMLLNSILPVVSILAADSSQQVRGKFFFFIINHTTVLIVIQLLLLRILWAWHLC